MHRRTLLFASAIPATAIPPLSFATTTTLIKSTPPRVLVFGDSNVWGWRPVAEGESLSKYSEEECWPGVMQRTVGSDWRVLANGLNARTLGTDLRAGIAGLSGEDHNGIKRLPMTILSSSPVNFVIVMLGTNDLISNLDRSPLDVASNIATYSQLVQQLTKPHPMVPKSRLLVVAPPPLGDVSRGMFRNVFDSDAVSKSKKLGAALQSASELAGVAFLDAGRILSTDGVDGVHLTAATHVRLGQAVAKAASALIERSGTS